MNQYRSLRKLLFCDLVGSACEEEPSHPFSKLSKQPGFSNSSTTYYQDLHFFFQAKGRGRKSLRSKDETILSDLDKLIESTVRGDPICGIRWTCKSTRKLSKEELRNQGHKVSHTTIAHELRKQEYSLQGNRKTDEGPSHPDHNA